MKHIDKLSGRAILWFWLTGLVTLLIGGYGIYKMITSNNTTTNPTTLVYQNTNEELPNNKTVDNSLINQSTELNENDELAAELSKINTEIETAKTNTNQPKTGKVKSSESKTIAKTSLASNSTSIEQTIGSSSKASAVESISNTVETISNTVGVPANLVITKSYINKDGSVIKQSDLNSETGDESPVYDVIINSEAKELNAGALLRIIEPLENIPLPAFQKTLKKKTQITIL